MNTNTAKALAWDAWAQVLDNRAFRVLCVLTALPVLLTFLVGFREDELVILFGWKRYDYEDILVFMDQSFVVGKDLRIQLIQGLQMTVGTYVAGTIGIFFSIAATAYFVPRMTEKGAADTIFSKPVSRLSLLMTCYLAGLLFVALLSLALNGGMALGLWLVSGYGDPTALWSVVTLTYMFALINGVSMLAGVVTRNTVAAMLLTMSFFVFNGCVHFGWERKEMSLERATAAGIEPEDVLTAEQDQLTMFLVGALDTMHYALPKTGDSSRLTLMLRKSLETQPLSFQDPVSEMGMPEIPGGFAAERIETVEPGPEDTETWAVLFAARDASGVRLEFARRRRHEHEDERGRTRRESVTKITDERFEERGESAEAEDVTQASRSAMGRRPAGFVTWRETSGDRRLHEEAYGISRQRAGDWVLRLSLSTPGGEASAQDPTERMDELSNAVGPTKLRHRNGEERDWFGDQFRWDAVWKYNPAFSIASSVAFASLMLLIAWWRLTRIDF